MKDKRPPPELVGAEAEIRDFALRFPEATEDTPWGERAIKVRGKTFVFMGGGEGSAFVMSVKLPASKAFALEYPFTSPTHYGMGKHGWVTARFEPGEDLPDDLLCVWITESDRAVAPSGSPRPSRDKGRSRNLEAKHLDRLLPAP